MPDHARSTDSAVQHQLDRLWALSPGADILGLERITELLARVGNPHERLPPVLHVAGTNGKGSTCAFLRAGVEAAGYTTHVYSSPHLVRFNERIRLAGRLIDDAELAPLLAEVLDAGGDIGASFFEVTTAVAFLAFSRTPAGACIVEVGLGGRLDATNVIAEPIVTGIAQLGIDHERFLGSDPEGIAAEKAGIAKPHVPLVTMRYPPRIEARIASVARAADAPIAAEGGHWSWSADETHVTYRDAAGRVTTPLPRLAGSHQQANLALAIAMLRHQRALTIPPGAYVAAAEQAAWPARLQRLGPGPLTAKLPGRAVLVDGGHNADAAQAIAAALADAAPIDLIFGLMKNRRIADVLGPIAPLVRTAHVAPLIGHEHHDPRDIAAFAQAHAAPRHCYPALSLEQAIDRLSSDPDGAPLVLIAGSLYLAGEALAANEEIPV
ncbi:bifunctional folylpolyglutamate synthase/dihydrofolate synthase [Sphingomonas sp.]|jgi:dihydrofolate synthase/folylpolyglutamate synthase|uniref:bifunctional folylpolyglutamate synthase/dihydrofolate synthase n=1 Tax=Sphingomonas sp. TaxID=28214 RepID=UPI002E302A4C|nr:bifunctional folylpolyglutamate synthase/dihydrofolate synthase [Sphingomonas sp.]HEX4693429.1 bifunctional folylpolyglutamate synthase/dihydrofolate synthase [Sphingomonas sp.]